MGRHHERIFANVTLSILIVNWHSKDYLRKCLQSVESTCNDLAPQVVVVDGGSFDGCGEMLASQFPHVEFVQGVENIGFARSNNLGFTKVTGEALLLLNPDTELKPGSVRILLDKLNELPAAGIIGGRLLNSDGSLQVGCVQSLPTPLNQGLDSRFLRKMFPNARMWGTRGVFSSVEPVAVEAISGACMLMRSETFRKVGGFNSDYFMYGEDMDLCSKVQDLGLKIFHVPSAAIIHHGGGSSSDGSSTSSALLMRESVYLFIRTRHGLMSAFAYRCVMAASSVVRLALLAPAYLFVKSSLKNEYCASIRKWAATLLWSIGFTDPENDKRFHARDSSQFGTYVWHSRKTPLR